MKIAIVHEWFVDYSGSERVVEQMINCFPNADLYALVDFLPSNERGFIKNKSVKTSFIQKLPFSKKYFRSYFFLFPFAIEQFDLRDYDLIISSNHAFSKGIITSPNQIHLCMCYSPIRYAWDLYHQYLIESNLSHGIKSLIAKYILHKIRIWDIRTVNGVDEFIAISNFISKRIYKFYRRESIVIYPPVDIDKFIVSETKEEFYLVVSRMVPYKRIPLIIESFRAMPDKKLIVIGNGPDFDKCKKVAGTNVTLLGWQPITVLRNYMQRAKAFIFAAEEDFGIAPLEAQACGTPVIAFGKGAALETIRGLEDKLPTGVFFYEQSVSSIINGINSFENNRHLIFAEACRDNAMKFSPEIFRENFTKFVINQLRKK